MKKRRMDRPAPGIHGERIDPQRDEIEEFRLAINDLALEHAVLKAEIARMNRSPKWDEARIVNLELAHDPLHETIWAAIRGLQLSTADAQQTETLRREIKRIWEKIGRTRT